jgi:hypothetical protein
MHVFSFIIQNLTAKAGNDLTEKYGYIDTKNNITNPKFFYLTELFGVASSILMTIFYQSIGKTMGYQTPSYIHTYGYLSLSMGSVSGAPKVSLTSFHVLIWQTGIRQLEALLTESFNRDTLRSYRQRGLSAGSVFRYGDQWTQCI